MSAPVGSGFGSVRCRNGVFLPEVEAAGVTLRDGTETGVGDRVVTRLNARRLIGSSGRSVRNGSTWTVTERWSGGALTVIGEHGNTVTLSPGYVAESVELGYAATVHRAQGASVDTANVIARDGMSREAYYVGMTRGRAANHAYVVTGDEPAEDHQAEPPRTVDEVLAGILTEPGAERSATELICAELEAAGPLARLVPMYECMAQAAEADRWRNQLTAAAMEPERVHEVLNSPAWPALVADLRHAEAQGLDTDRLLADCITCADFTGAHDTAAVLHARLDARTRAARRKGLGHDPTNLAGMVRPAVAPDDPTIARMLSETEDLIGHRVGELADRAITDQPAWVARVGLAPTHPIARATWAEAVTVVAAYRERHSVTTVDPLGPQPPAHDYSRKQSHAHAIAAIESARAMNNANPLGTTTAALCRRQPVSLLCEPHRNPVTDPLTSPSQARPQHRWLRPTDVRT